MYPMHQQQRPSSINFREECICLKEPCNYQIQKNELRCQHNGHLSLFQTYDDLIKSNKKEYSNWGKSETQIQIIQKTLIAVIKITYFAQIQLMKLICKGKSMDAIEKQIHKEKEKLVKFSSVQICQLLCDKCVEIQKIEQLLQCSDYNSFLIKRVIMKKVIQQFKKLTKTNKICQRKTQDLSENNSPLTTISIAYQILIFIQTARRNPISLIELAGNVSESLKNSQMKSQEEKYNILQKKRRSEDCENQKDKNMISLRGGGCGVSSMHTEVEKLQKKPEKKALIPLNFLTDLNKYLEILISKAPFASDGQQKEEIMIALQWFIVMKEHFNSLCLDSKSASSVFDLIFKSVPQLLKSLVTYIRISGFLCLQVLQIINDLCRVLFTFYMKNQNRYMDIKDREQLDELISDFEIQLDIESSNIWVGGAEFEVAMIKAVIQSSLNNSEEGQKLLKTFLGGLVQSVLTMSPSDDLIDSLIEGAKFLYKENKVRNLKKNYEVYYYFESLKWYMIQLLRQDVSPKRALQLLQNAFKKYIENSKEWLLNFCWVKLISDLLSSRPIITKQELSINSLEQQKIWNQLIKYKFINQCSFNKQLGRLILFQDQQNQETQELNQIMKRIGIRAFQIFSDLLRNSLEYSELNLFTFKNKIENQQKKIDYLFGLFQENTDLSESVENLIQQSAGLKQLFEKIKRGYEKWKSLAQENHKKSRNFQLDEIVENTQDLIKQCFYAFTVSINVYKTFQLYFERSKLILNSIEQVENTIKQMMEGVYNMFYKDCSDKLNSEENKLQLIDSLITLEVNFNQIKLEAINHQLITEKLEIILQFFNCIDQFIKPFEVILKKLQIISEKHFSRPKQSSTKYNEEVKFIVLEQIEKKINNQSCLFSQIDFIFTQFQATYSCSKLAINLKYKYYFLDIIDQMNAKKETISKILIFFQKNQGLLSIFLSEEKCEEIGSPQNLVDEMLQNEFQLFQQFFRQEGTHIDSEQQMSSISIDKLLQMLKNHTEKLEEMQTLYPQSKTLLQVRYDIAIVEQYLNIYIENPQKVNQIKEQIFKIYEDNDKKLIEQMQTISFQEQKQEKKAWKIKKSFSKKLKKNIKFNQKLFPLQSSKAKQLLESFKIRSSFFNVFNKSKLN